METRTATRPTHASAVVWLDRNHALVARALDDRPEVIAIDRAFDLESGYLRRILHETESCERLVVMGPDAARVALEREYVALYRRPDRLIDVGQLIAPRQCDLLDQLRSLDPALVAAG